MTRFTRLSFVGASAGAIALLAFATGAGKPQDSPDYGYVLTKLSPAFYRGDEKIDCPEGRSPSLREGYLLTQSPQERARLLKPENSIELETKYKNDFVYGANGQDICTTPAAFDTPERPLQNTVQSKVGPGLDLDGAKDDSTPAPGTCAHQSFEGAAGETGVDNQFFRAIACNTFWRGAPGGGTGDAVRESPLERAAAVMLLRDVQSWESDPSVQVVIAGSPDDAPTDVRQKVVAGGSLTMTSERKWRTTLSGRIENGTLITEPADLVLPRSWVGAMKGEFIMKRARLRLKLQPDGQLAGVAGGYRPLDNLVGIFMIGGPGVASVAGLDCASVRKTLRVLADGDPDPKTGACSTVSMALDFAAAPAFVFDDGALVGAPGGKAIRTAGR